MLVIGVSRTLIAGILIATAILQSSSASLVPGKDFEQIVLKVPQGKVTIVLPNDLAEGDTISGVVLCDPSGQRESDRLKNSAVLQGIVINSPSGKSTAKDGKIEFRVSSELGKARLDFSEGTGNHLGTASVPVDQDPDDLLRHVAITLPSVAEAGRPMRVYGPFDGSLGNTTAKIGATDVPVIAESPRLVVLLPPATSGPTQIEVGEKGKTSKGDLHLLKIELSAPKTTLVRGERTEIQVQVSGLDGITDPIGVRVENQSPQAITLDGGDEQTHIIKPSEVANGGCAYPVPFTARRSGGFTVRAELQLVADVKTIGFKADPQDPKKVVPDGSDLKDGDHIKPRGFDKDGLDTPQNSSDPTGPKWQDRGEPYSFPLPGITVWMQRVATKSLTSDGKDYRGGEWRLQFKHTGEDCKDGTWRQIVRRTEYEGPDLDHLQPVEIANGYGTPSSDKDHKGDWEIDTNNAGRASKNADYPHQDKGEMIDTPQSARENFAGYYMDSGHSSQPMAFAVEVEFYSFFIGKDGMICRIMHWSFRTTWAFKDGDDPADSDAMNRSTVTSTFSDPKSVDPDSDEGKAATADYKGALANFMKMSGAARHSHP